MKKLVCLLLAFTPLFLFSQNRDSVTKAISSLETQLKELKLSQEEFHLKIELLKFKLIHSYINEYGIPVSATSCENTKHNAFVLCYDEAHEQSRWVEHVILPDIADGNISRTNDFREDSLVKTGTAVKDDYWYSGFDRGHLAPSADFRWSKTALSESYLYSNISPQKPLLNRERWSDAEDLLRAYVIKNKTPLLVVTGPVLSEKLQKIGKNEVSVPEYFFKAAWDPATGNSIGFIMKNEKCEYPVLSYVQSIDSIESLTGLDLFPLLTKEQQKSESAQQTDPWKTAKEEGNTLPLDAEKLPKGKLNTIQAQYHIGEKVTVCGTVVSAKYTEKSGATFLNLDRQFPGHVFTIAIWKDDRVNFSYKPEEYLAGKIVCVTGVLKDNKGKPQVEINSESSIIIADLDTDE